MSAVITVPTHPNLKLGRQSHIGVPPRLMKFADIKAARGIDTSQIKPFDYTTVLPDDMGVLWNNTYGCCTSAAKYHRWQMVAFQTLGRFIPADGLDDLVLRFYSETCGFDPTQTDPQGNNPTDNGGNMQAIADFLVKTGMPMPDGTTDQFMAAFSIDPADAADLAYCGMECVGIDFGIDVTTMVMPSDGSPPPLVWDRGGTEEGGHDVYAGALLPNGNWRVNSWGKWYEWTPAFHAQNVTEAICYVSIDALKDGKTVLGMDIGAWDQLITSHAKPILTSSL